jgi:hypothetical protein
MPKKDQPKSIPSFATLSEIMQHYERVPFDQFKKDLNLWFETECKAKADNDSAFRALGGANFPEQFQDLVAKLFSEAERLDSL